MPNQKGIMAISSYQNILVALDLSENSEHILKRANEIAKAVDARLSLVHVMTHTPMTYGGEFSIPIDAELEAALSKEAKLRLAQLAKNNKIENASQYIKEGTVKNAVISLASEIKADLIIVGSHGHNGLATLLGSQANAILHAANCDVWMIHI